MKGKASSLSVWAVLAMVQTSYCVWHILAKKAMNQGIHPLIIAFYRESIACLCMYTLSSLIDKRFVWTGFKLENDWKQYVGMGLLSFGNTIGFILALYFITAFNASLLHPSIPVFSAIFGVSSGLEVMNKSKGIGIFLCALGAIIVVVWGVSADKTPGGGKHVVLGNIILIFQCACMGALLVVQKVSLNDGCPPATLTARYYSIASILTILTTIIVVPESHEYFIFNSIEPLLTVMYGGTIGVSFVYIALAWAVRESSPATAAISLTLQPPFNAILSMIFMGRTSFTIGEIIGGLFIILGLIVTIHSQNALSNEDGEIEIGANPMCFSGVGSASYEEEDDDDDDLRELYHDQLAEMMPPPPPSTLRSPNLSKLTSPPRYIRKKSGGNGDDVQTGTVM